MTKSSLSTTLHVIILVSQFAIGLGSQVKADPRVCPPLAEIAMGTAVARNNGTPFRDIKEYIRAEFGRDPNYEAVMLIVEKTYYGFPNATPEQVYAETLAQCGVFMQ
jgi:hypothetical protein